jgi:hypothetical protein
MKDIVDHQKAFELMTKTTKTPSRSNTFSFTPYQRSMSCPQRSKSDLQRVYYLEDGGKCGGRDKVGKGVKCQSYSLAKDHRHFRYTVETQGVPWLALKIAVDWTPEVFLTEVME